MYMLSWDRVLDTDAFAELVASGYSRIPVYQGDRGNIRGFILVKKLIVLDAKVHSCLFAIIIIVIVIIIIIELTC